MLKREGLCVGLLGGGDWVRWKKAGLEKGGN